MAACAPGPPSAVHKIPSRPGRPRRSAAPHEQPPEVLLYVEDDDDNWEVAELRLSRSYTLLCARSDEEACRILRERRGEIDIVLMDLELRGSALNGIELTSLIRGIPPRPELPEYARDLPPLSKPVIYVTAHGARYPGGSLLGSGADKVIHKPVNFRELQVALSELLLNRTRF
jgi:CheY-like chemotaxis protein